MKCNGTEPASFKPLCGRYSYFMNVALFTGAQNGGLADFSHTLGVVSVDGGAAQPLNAVSPVPEPAPALLLAAGLGALAWRHRHRR